MTPYNQSLVSLESKMPAFQVGDPGSSPGRGNFVFETQALNGQQNEQNTSINLTFYTKGFHHLK